MSLTHAAPVSRGYFSPLIAHWVYCLKSIEHIAVLSAVVLHYEITVLQKPQYAPDTAEERKASIFGRACSRAAGFYTPSAPFEPGLPAR